MPPSSVDTVCADSVITDSGWCDGNSLSSILHQFFNFTPKIQNKFERDTAHILIVLKFLLISFNCKMTYKNCINQTQISVAL